MRAKHSNKYLSEINVIPYVDIMLVLLLIFMVTAPFLIQGINVDLPKVESPAIEDFENNSLTISIDKAGNYYLEIDTFKNISMDLSELEFELNKIIPNNKIEVFIRADARVIFNDVAVLMSSLQKFRPNSINFLTNPQDD
ncbi:MAG: biopolymer transporter ExbD [Pseudomonadota bacterium]|nr:biopolymer transporter ExbD [Pseudomonadota bacterium]MEC7465709.1 biopolymer transporter ExbD [Pseudomonadota bacterium]MEC7787637.1 biopolymer transporter ExbD [Pseudomonadota bacterium]MEC8168762.1 biopolymer transporter ExbD [Pseudomonadota bacterium]MEC8378299.1 biopolymer transporter ExbD [Pseudomonadota bacterium]